ncbi:hypothetical protein HMPREF9946_00807 [Acetobacteraceae bacterium AT-5844]|nr:hypothetical protein HMPREF9946_00807 [Acetobacteraceae bacterium AT-5844]
MLPSPRQANTGGGGVTARVGGGLCGGGGASGHREAPGWNTAAICHAQVQ